MIQKKTLSIIFIISIIALLLIAGVTAYYTSFLSKLEKEPISEPIPITTIPEQEKIPAGWEIYRNEQYGFEVGYPKDLQVKETFERDVVSFSILNKNKKNIENFLLMIFYTEDLETEIKNRREFLFNNKTFKIENAKEEKVLFNNITAVKLSAKIFSLRPDLNFEYSNQIDIFIGRGKNLHIFCFISPENEKENFELFNTILSTFKFLE